MSAATGIPAALAQRSLWLLHQMYPESRAAYNLKTAYRVRGKLDVSALEQSLAAMLERHATLRTTFAEVDGEPIQVVHPPSAFKLVEVDLSASSPVEREAQLARELEAQAAQPFDLQCGPLVRALLFRLASDEHVVLVIIHHIVFDDGALAAFNREWSASYRALHRGELPALPPLRLTYAQAAVREHETVQVAERARALDYWRTTLAGIPARIELPVDRPRPAVGRFRGAVSTLGIPAVSAARITSFGRNHRATLYMTLLAAFDVLLYRYTGQRDLVVGSPVANRTSVDIEELVGFFVNMVALRTTLDGGSTFIDVVRAAREAALGALEHQAAPFEDVVAALRPDRTAGAAPLYNVMFFVRSDVGAPPHFEDCAVERVPIASTRSKLDLSLRITERPDGALSCSMQYDTDLFERSTIERMLRHYANLLDAAVAEPDRAIGTLPMLDAAERRRAIVEWNATAAPYAGNRPLAELFEEQVDRAPDTIAIRSGAQRLTYRGLNAAANRLARELRAHGFAPGDVAGIFVERSMAAIVAAIATLKAGGTYLPLDVEYPAERLAHMVRDANARIVVTHGPPVPDAVQRAGIAVIDASARAIRERRSDNLGPVGPPATTVAIFYTSGSTGRPKGVPVPNRGVTRLLTGAAYIDIRAADVVAQTCSFSFDVATFEIWGALLHGARLEIIARDTLLLPDALHTEIATRKITLMFLTAALFRYLAGARPATFDGLRCLVVGGEAVDPSAAAAVLEAGPPSRLINGYGPTEATTFATMYDITLPVSTPIPIGRPISNTEAYIFDADRNLVPPGVSGQLYLGGPGVAPGYLNDPELTARKFITHPFTAQPNARLYATGDVARYRADGTIEFLGRADRQVKLRGFRIEIDEIEHALGSISDVRDGVVVLHDEPGNARLIAYVVTADGEELALEALRERLRRTLPDYMLPSAVVTLEAIPLTAGGKVDYRALPAPPSRSAAVGRSAADRIAGPRSVQLTALWCDLLGVRSVRPDDTFFELGGNSLLATRMIAQVGRLFGRPIPLSAFFANPTIAQLAELLASDVMAPESPLIKVREGGSKTPFFFLHGDMRGGGHYVYNMIRELGNDRSFYALPPHGFDDSPLPPTIEAMARDYVSVIREVQPHGPYALGGYCQGGLVALEIAQQLRREGETVAKLILLDSTGASGYFSRVIEAFGRLAATLRLDHAQRAALRRRAVRFVAAVHEFHAATVRARDVSHLARATLRRLRHPAPQPYAILGEADRVVAQHERVQRAYVPRPYRGPLTLLLPVADVRERGFSLGGWKSVATTLRVASVPGDHDTCITTFVADTAARIDEQLREAEAPANAVTSAAPHGAR